MKQIETAEQALEIFNREQSVDRLRVEFVGQGEAQASRGEVLAFFQFIKVATVNPEIIPVGSLTTLNSVTNNSTLASRQSVIETQNSEVGNLSRVEENCSTGRSGVSKNSS